MNSHDGLLFPHFIFSSVLYSFINLIVIVLFGILMMSSNLLLLESQLEQGYDNILEEINLDEMTISSRTIPEDTIPPFSPMIKTIDLDTHNQTTPKHTPNTTNRSEEKKMKKKVIKKTQAKCKFSTCKMSTFITTVLRILFQPIYIIFKCLSIMMLKMVKKSKLRKH